MSNNTDDLTTNDEQQQRKATQTYTVALPDHFEVLHRRISTSSVVLSRCEPDSQPPGQPSPLGGSTAASSSTMPDFETTVMQQTESVNSIHDFLKRFLSREMTIIGYKVRGRRGWTEEVTKSELHQCEICKVPMTGGRKHWFPVICNRTKADRLKHPEQFRKEPYVTGDQVGVMYYDPDMTFTKEFFFGRTADLFVFETLLFTCVALNTNSCAVASVVVVLVGWILSTFRVIWGAPGLEKSVVM